MSKKMRDRPQCLNTTQMAKGKSTENQRNCFAQGRAQQ